MWETMSSINCRDDLIRVLYANDPLYYRDQNSIVRARPWTELYASEKLKYQKRADEILKLRASMRMAANWWDAQGGTVNDEGFDAAVDLCVLWGLDRDASIVAVYEICNFIRRDKPNRAFMRAENLLGRANQTAVYRLLATLASHVEIEDHRCPHCGESI